jgi:GR25 family glycosyltransferase involved in LPS biosynthesis
MDQGEFPLDKVYRFDPALFTQQIMSVKECMIGGTLKQGRFKEWPWTECVRLVRGLDLSTEQTFRDHPWLRPQPLSPGEVSLVLKHRIAWERIAAQDAEYAIVAEDDVVLFDHSLAYLPTILSKLPDDFDYIDLAGGVGLSAVRGDPVVNTHFFRIDPPRDRTSCCAIIRRRFAQRALEADPRIVLGSDWMLTYLFNAIGANVYWVEPLVFGHGSQMQIYQSNLIT